MDIVCKHMGYKFFAKLDIIHVHLLVKEFKCFPDIAQAIRENILSADVYFYDVGAFSSSLEHHIKHLITGLFCLNDNGLTINTLKCTWDVPEADWLGYWLSPCGIKP
ncbi:hypothetical protein ACHAW6_012064 [Cyclotella cf. meneghiniana]